MTSIKSVWMAAVCMLAVLCCTNQVWADGACCLLDGTCVTTATATDCQMMGGAFSGQNSSCAVIDCIGACCLPDGTCEQRSQRDCVVNAFGTFRGNGIDCYNGQCDSFTGACTMPDGTCTGEIEFLECEGMGGYWRGYDTECGALSHTGACCFDDGTCTPSQTQNQCDGAGGSFQGFGTNCPAGDCFSEKHMLVYSEEPPVPNVPLTLPRFDEMGGARELQKVTFELRCSVDAVNILGNTNKTDGDTTLEFNLLIGAELQATTPSTLLTCIDVDSDDPGTNALFCGPNPLFQLEPGDWCDYGSSAANSAFQETDLAMMMFQEGVDDLSGFIVSGGDTTFTTLATGSGQFSPVLIGGVFINDTRVVYELIVCYEFAPKGACCLPLPGNGCIVVTEDDCIAQGGTYQGDDTICLPTGACCLPDGTCVDVSETCCDDFGGTFLGGACSPNTGACCLPDGTCVEINETCCLDQNGTFVGGNCGPSGACCLPGGACIQTPEACCIDMGGVFVGGPCGPPGACCLPDGTCVEIAEACCLSEGGTFVGGNCGPSGACCLPDGTCIETPMACCTDQGGEFIGGDCSPNTGACCLPDGTCVDLNETCCVDQGGEFIGGNCSPNTGACCLPDGTCVEVNETCCIADGGSFVGGACGTIGACCLPNGTCIETSMACCTDQGGDFVGGDCGGVGACCLPNGTCVEIDEACCLDQGGDFLGAGTVCGNTGACCFPDGSCSIEIQACCVIAGGTFVGDGTVCGMQGACCLSDGTCLDDQFEACCEALGGDFQGAGTVCTPNLCVPRDGGCSEKGSLVIFSKIEIRWDANGNLLQDTFLQLTNDFPDDVNIQMYFVNGDPPLPATADERAHPGWNWVDNEIVLTADQPTYWSALTGLGGNGPNDPTFSPFTVLDPGFPPGRPDPEVPGERMLRGFIMAWAVDQNSNQEIRWNHLAGLGTLVHYRDGWAWEYRTCGIPVVNPAIAHGQLTGTPGVLNLDGIEYRAADEELLMNFQAVNSSAFSGLRLVSSTTDVTLHPIDADLRQETDGPVTTKAHYQVWNMNELKLSGAFRCITCWDQSLLSSYGTPNHFFLNTLQTDHGKARIDGLASALCDLDLYGPGGPGTPPDGVLDVVSQDAALLGLTARLMSIDAGAEHAADGTNLFGLGSETAVIQYDVEGIPPENFFKLPGSPEGLDRLMQMLNGEIPGIYPGQ